MRPRSARRRGNSRRRSHTALREEEQARRKSEDHLSDLATKNYILATLLGILRGTTRNETANDQSQ